MSELHAIHTADAKMRKLLGVAENVAASKATVLITGESGTGKELVARYIHAKSQRSHRRLVAVNCAAVPDGLLESELFGYEKGAFTNAEKTKPGKFEQAHEGTFLLDEISELPLLLQAKLLRVIQEGEVERLGAIAPIKVNVRLLATSNRSLRKMVEEGRFREDLFYRLNVIPLEIPPLRDRHKDVEILAKHFISLSCKENQISLKQLSPSALECLKSWSWPGNIRELQNVMERSVLLSPGDWITADDLTIKSEDHLAAKEGVRAGTTVSEMERRLILKTLEHTGNNRTRAAELLGISIRTLRNKLHEYRGEVGQ